MIERKTNISAKSPARRHLLPALLLALALLLGAGCSQETTNQLERAAEQGRAELEKIAGEASTAAGDNGRTHTVTISGVTDGDTIEIDRPIKGRTGVRLIGVDTPETYGGEQPLGPEATWLTTRKLEGEQVELTLGADPVDPYDRLLANVVVTGEQKTHAENLLALGLAQTLFYEPNTERRQLFENIQADARQRQAGIWGLPVSKQCQLEDRGNGVGSGSPGC